MFSPRVTQRAWCVHMSETVRPRRTWQALVQSSRAMRGNQIADICHSLVSRWWYDATAGAPDKYRQDAPPSLHFRVKTRRCASIPLEQCELKDLLPKHMFLSRKKRLSLPAPVRTSPPQDDTGPRGGGVGLKRALTHQTLSLKNPAPRTSGGVLVFASPELSFRPALWLGAHTGKEKFQRRHLIQDSTECSLPVRGGRYTGATQSMSLKYEPAGARLHSSPPREQQRLTSSRVLSPPLKVIACHRVPPPRL